MSSRRNLSYPKCQCSKVRPPNTVPFQCLILIVRSKDLNLEGHLNADGTKVLIDTYFSLSLLNVLTWWSPDYNRPAIKEAINILRKNKKEYAIRFEKGLAGYKQREEEARKRARDELPSDNESSTPSQKGSQSKKHRKKKRKSIEEEIFAPKLSNNGTAPFPPKPNGIVASCEGTDVPPLPIAQIISTNTATLKPRKFRLECRVHAFHPPSLADFAAAWCDSCNNT